MCKILHFQHLGHVITILHALMHWIRWQATFAIFKLSIKCHTEWNFCWMEQYEIEWWIASSNKHINKHVLNKSKWLRCWSKEISRMHVNDIGTVRWYYENQWIFNALKIKTKLFFFPFRTIFCVTNLLIYRFKLHRNVQESRTHSLCQWNQNGQKRVILLCTVHPLLVFAIYRSVKLCANTNIKVATQRSHLGRSKMQRWTFVDFHFKFMKQLLPNKFSGVIVFFGRF